VTNIIVSRVDCPAHCNLETVCRAAEPFPPKRLCDPWAPAAQLVKGFGAEALQTSDMTATALIVREIL